MVGGPIEYRHHVSTRLEGSARENIVFRIEPDFRVKKQMSMVRKRGLLISSTALRSDKEPDLSPQSWISPCRAPRLLNPFLRRYRESLRIVVWTWRAYQQESSWPLWRRRPLESFRLTWDNRNRLSVSEDTGERIILIGFSASENLGSWFVRVRRNSLKANCGASYLIHCFAVWPLCASLKRSAKWLRGSYECCLRDRISLTARHLVGDCV